MDIGILYFINILLFQLDLLKYSSGLYIISILLIIKRIKILKFSNLEILLYIFTFIIFIISKNPKLLLIITLAGCIKAVDQKKILIFVEKFWKIGVILLIGIIILNVLEMIDPKYLVYSSGKIRSGLGFKNPNMPSLYYFILVSHYYFYKWENLKIRNYIFIMIGYFIIYKYTLSRTGAIIAVFQLLSILILKNKIKIKKLFCYVPYIFFVLSFIIAFFYNPTLNKFMTTRPFTWKMNILDNSNILNILFGSFGIRAQYALDNGILSNYYYFGIIATILFLYLFSKGLMRLEKKIFERTFILFLSYLLYSLSEDMLITVNTGLIQMIIISRALRSKNKS